MNDLIKVCTVVFDESPYTSSGVEYRKKELMVVSTAPQSDADFIVLAKFIILGGGKSDIRTFKMKYSEFQAKVESGDYNVVNLD